MEAVPVKIVPRGYGETERQDAWWIEPILVFVVFSSFLGYGTWAAMQNANFEFPARRITVNLAVCHAPCRNSGSFSPSRNVT